MFLSSGILHGSLAAGWVGDNINEQSQVRIALASEEDDDANIEWFRDQLKISSKYKEKERGVLGLSWTHFLTMVFLICLFIIALIVLIARYRRTKELLKLLLKEEKEDGI